jgi:hypothetical protein
VRREEQRDRFGRGACRVKGLQGEGWRLKSGCGCGSREGREVQMSLVQWHLSTVSGLHAAVLVVGGTCGRGAI